MRVIHTTNNIFDMPTSENEAVCITTNGIIKRDGTAVMGAGIAKEADNRFHLSKELAQHLRTIGNVPHLFTATGIHNSKLISFPTKQHWKDDSSLALIEQSAQYLINLVDTHNIQQCYLTPPGCGCGHLSWETVKPILEKYFDNRFSIVVRH